MFREAQNEREDQRVRASCPSLAEPLSVGPEGRSRVRLGQPRAPAKPMNKIRPGKRKLKSHYPQRGRASPLFSRTPTHLSFKDASGPHRL